MSARRGKLLLLGGTLLFCLLVGEVFSRFLMSSKFKTPLMYAPSPYTSFTLVPGLAEPHRSREFDVTYNINEDGYRGAKVATPKPANTKRYLLTGDSFAFGHGVADDETVSAVLAKKLGENVEVVNLGFTAGTAPDDAYSFLASPRAAKLEPDAVIELIFIQNDMRDMTEHEWPKTDDHGLPASVISPTGGPNELRGRGSVPFYKSNALFRNIGLVQLAGRAYFALYLLPERGKYLKQWAVDYHAEHGGLSDRFGKVVRGLDRLTKEKGWPLYVGIIPATKQTIGKKAPLYDDALTKLKAILDERSVPYVVFDGDGAGIGKDDLYPLDSHWKPTGHDKAAAALQKLIETARSDTRGVGHDGEGEVLGGEEGERGAVDEP